MLLFSICAFLWVVCGLAATFADWLLRYNEITVGDLVVLVPTGAALGPLALLPLLGRLISYDHVVFSLGKSKTTKDE